MNYYRIGTSVFYHLGITYFSSAVSQVTILEFKDGKSIRGYFQGLENKENNTWRFRRFGDQQDVIIEGDDVVSISLSENGNRLYFQNDGIVDNRLGLSKYPETVKQNYYFTNWPVTIE